MKLFKLNKTNLNEVEQIPFKLEKDIQSLVEVNVESVFNLKFIQSELSVDKYRIDTLCFDEENNSFVIIEYKKGKSYSVIDQGYTYLQLLLNNKSDFLLVLSQHFNKVLRMEDIDWSQSRIIFVSPSFNSYQKDSVNFKGLPFELWEIKRYSNDTVVLNEHRSNSKESIETLNPTTNSTISQVSKEVKVYTEDEHTSKMNKTILESWIELKEELLELGGVEFVPKRHYMGLNFEGTNVCYINFRKSHILIDILGGTIYPDKSKSRNFLTLEDHKNFTSKRSRILNSGGNQISYRIKFDSNSDIDYVMLLIKQSYKSKN
ncbi:DUF5655 domain-containing protein [Polaribacter sp.]|uniref:DUF5655 domain-containing protein n=1 Tax=Polaribacter sp. TaxID=1920175 RepID=UPI003F698500